MGMCKGCSEVFNTNDMKDGYCKSCKPELLIEGNIQNKSQIVDKESIEKESIGGGIVSIVFGLIILIGGGIYAYMLSTKPSDEVVKNIASQYKIKYAKESDISIIKSYEKDGKLIYILNIKGSICEMPMIQINKDWNSIGIQCNG